MAEVSINIQLSMDYDADHNLDIRGDFGGHGNALNQAILLASALNQMLDNIGVSDDAFRTVMDLTRQHTLLSVVADKPLQAQEADQ